MSYQLALVMPVYNEQECIVDVVESWKGAFARLDIDFLMIVLNDGSRDGTQQALCAFDADDRIEVVHKANSGHGPTILEGYRRAVEAADWVFQCDSDDEMKPDSFSTLWEKRDDFDVLFGIRSGRQQNAARALISTVSRLTVSLLFGSGVEDVNTPYRLIRAPILKQIIEQIPADTFAPNVIISGALARGKRRIHNLPVPHEGRKTGTVSIVKWSLVKAAVKSFWQTLWCRPSLPRSEAEPRG